MQAQATSSRRYGINRMVLLALAIGILAIAAAVTFSTIDFGADEQASTLVAHPAPLQGEGHIDPANAVVSAAERLPVIRYTAPYAGEGLKEMGFLEWNILPDVEAAAPVQSIERTHFLEQNTQLPTSTLSRPALSVEDMLLLEQNTWAYDGDASAQPPGDYLDPAIGDVLPSAPASADIVSAPPQGRDDMHFLEQNVWEYVDGSAASPALDDFLYAEEYVPGWKKDDARSTAPGIHRHEGFNH